MGEQIGPAGEPRAVTHRPIRLVVNGASGRVGQLLIALLQGDERFTVVGALAPAGAVGLGKPIDVDHPLQLSSDWSALDAFDVVIDFSSPAGLAQALDACQVRAAALVSGTTGLDASLLTRLKSASKNSAVLHAGNFSLGVAVLTGLLSQAAAALPDWDLEIIDAHHGRKQDAPSGTALQLGHAAARARDVALGSPAMRAHQDGPRKAGSIGFAAVRGGDIVGEHTALLAGQGERIELVHRATDRAIFARGAIQAARWLHGKPPGAYALDQMLAERLPG